VPPGGTPPQGPWGSTAGLPSCPGSVPLRPLCPLCSQMLFGAAEGLVRGEGGSRRHQLSCHRVHHGHATRAPRHCHMLLALWLAERRRPWPSPVTDGPRCRLLPCQPGALPPVPTRTRSSGIPSSSSHAASCGRRSFVPSASSVSKTSLGLRCTRRCPWGVPSQTRSPGLAPAHRAGPVPAFPAWGTADIEAACGMPWAARMA